MKKINFFDMDKTENDTYDFIDAKIKERISRKEILEHWEARANRKSVQSVMSARHPLEENEKATQLLIKDILDFLGDELKDKKVFELGCGIGRMTKVLAKQSKLVYVIDFSPKMIERAKLNLKSLNNVEVRLGTIFDFKFESKSFDLVFESIVLLHILDPTELKKTIEKMKNLTDTIFICEHTFETEDFPISRFSILRKPKEYEQLFKPFKLIKQKTHFCAGDKFTLMLFKVS